jgi:hypothetical protein
MMDRRRFLAAAATTAGAAVGLLALPRGLAARQAAPQGAKAAAQPALPVMTVYKSPSCGCCSAWVDHVKKAGFTVRTVDTDDLAPVKREMGVPQRLASCHTVAVGAYVLEGHVPADDVKKLLATKPKVRGLAVPGMPIGSPGMEQGPPANYDRYDVLAFTATGATSVFATHGPPARRD